jgi:cysteine desulfurase/selenocysteine lyase
MNIEKIRQDFPLLQIKVRDKPIIYFDNACQTLRPQSVLNAMNGYYERYSGCAGRSMHMLGDMVTKKCNESREAVAKFIKAKRKEEIIFTRNATEGINLIAHSFGLDAGDMVLITDKEHNSNLIPWQVTAKNKGAFLSIAYSKKDNTFDLEKFEEMMSGQIKLVALVYTSNLDGVSNPVKEIIKIAHHHGAKVLLDAAQAAPHQGINVVDLDVDFLAFSGHKMLGLSGTGVLYGKYNLLENLEPFMVGGETVEYSTYEGHKLLSPPEKFEAGLQDFAGIIGLGAAINYINKIGLKNIAKQEEKLNRIITEGLLDIPDLKIIGPPDSALRSGIVSFYVEGKDSHQIALMLDSSANIMVRSGQFCVHSWFSSHRIENAVRASMYFYNTEEEAYIFVDSLKKIINII